jgi:ATP-dependent RNA helicase SUPV3L1/SUV3
MWGSSAIGKLVAGADALKPQVEAFVDEEAGPDVAEKVRRRLQHFIDRKIGTLFEPLLAMSRDEALNGLARGFAFRLVEAMGILTRESVADEVKALDQDARGALRKHGIRFGQYTIFLPALLKPAPTRLRLVLWSLANGLQEFPESPPPGLVTIPHIPAMPAHFYTLSGYRPAGERAIRIDMLERLADMIRPLDSRAGFEATADMLSITGMTLDQFATLLQGLGYAAAPGEREKKKPAPAGEGGVAAEKAAPVEISAEDIARAAEAAAADAAAALMAGVEVEADATAEGHTDGATDADIAPEAPPVEMEAFYTFTWAPKRAPRDQGRPRGPRGGQPRAEGEAQPARAERPQGGGGKRHDGKPRRDERTGDGGGDRGGKPFNKGGKPDRRRDEERAKSFEARPAKKDRIDPDNPFAAALMGFQVKK